VVLNWIYQTVNISILPYLVSPHLKSALCKLNCLVWNHFDLLIFLSYILHNYMHHMFTLCLTVLMFNYRMGTICNIQSGDCNLVIKNVFRSLVASAEDVVCWHKSYSKERVWRRSHKRWNFWYSSGVYIIFASSYIILPTYACKLLMTTLSLQVYIQTSGHALHVDTRISKHITSEATVNSYNVPPVSSYMYFMTLQDHIRVTFKLLRYQV